MMTTDVAVRDTDSWTTVLEPAQQLSVDIASTEFVPAALRGNPHKVLAAVMTGRELGLGPMQSLASIDVIEGRASLQAKAMLALIRAAGHQVRVVESGNQRCTMKARRREDRDDPDGWGSFTYTVNEAKQAGLLGKKNWQRYPQDMLSARVITRMARLMFPDVIMGLETSEVLIDGDTDVPVLTGEVVDHQPVTAPSAMKTVKSKTTTPMTRRSAATVKMQSEKPDLSLADIDTGETESADTASVNAESAAVMSVSASEKDPVEQVTGEIVDAEIIDDPVPVSDGQVKAYHTLLGKVGMDKAEGLQFAGDVTGRTDLSSSKDLTMVEASRVLDALTQLDAQQVTPPAKSVKSQWDRIIHLANELSLAKDDMLVVYSRVAARDVAGTKELTLDEARRVIIELQCLVNGGPMIDGTDHE
ncbi:MAG: hypothetical protein LBV06_07035 [Propionibacteriaceae bacterium]|jgi:hypothetical protein|nr:hypothetical protein [Propionibacteriaceae bacterium]